MTTDGYLYRAQAALHLFGQDPGGLPDLFREFDEAMESPEDKPGFRLVHAGEKP